MNERLTQNEREIMGLLAAGYRYGEIAVIRNRSWRTIKHQAYNAKWKLRARTMMQAVVMFYTNERIKALEFELDNAYGMVSEAKAGA